MKMTVRGTVVAKVSGSFKDKETQKEINYFQAWLLPEGEGAPEKASVTEEVYNSLEVPELPVSTYEIELGSSGKMKLLGVQVSAVIKKVS